MPWREFCCVVEMPEAELDFYNRGKSGNAVWQLKWRWQTDAVDFKPDLLSMLITLSSLPTHETFFTNDQNYFLGD
jgi:hypothetical protein